MLGHTQRRAAFLLSSIRSAASAHPPLSSWFHSFAQKSNFHRGDDTDRRERRERRVQCNNCRSTITDEKKDKLLFKKAREKIAILKTISNVMLLNLINNSCRGDVIHRTTKRRRWFQRAMAQLVSPPCAYSLLIARETIARPPLSRPRLLSRLPRSSRRTTNTTRRDFWTKCVCRTVVVERNAARSASPRREDGAKTSFVRLFRGKVFCDESTRFAHTNERMNAARSWILDYILARRCSWSYLTIKKGFTVSSKVPFYEMECDCSYTNRFS